MRKAPSLPGASAEQLALLQQVFGLATKPKDAADKLHADVKERMHALVGARVRVRVGVRVRVRVS